MAASKKQKQVKQKEHPKGRYVGQVEDPSKYYHQHPSWNFNSCDTEMWAFAEETIGNSFWREILPFFQALETQTWANILVGSNKQHHSIDVSKLNPGAQDRLASKFIEQDSIISLRTQATHRLYGYMVGSTFNILWFDINHGDNDSCVCRAHKKNT